MQSPRNSLEISKEWLEDILSEHESRKHSGTKVEVTFFQVNPGTKPGENFSSELVKMEVEAQLSGDGHQPPSSTQYSLVAKFLGGNIFNKEFVKSMKGDLKEFLIYSDIITELNNFQFKLAKDKYRINIPGFIYGKSTDHEHVLVMENLAPAGFTIQDVRQGLDLQHILVAVDQLARLHAVSYAYHRTHNFLEKFPTFQLNTNSYTVKRPILTVVYEGVMKILEPKKDNVFLEKMKMAKESILNDYMSLCMNRNGQKFFCLCHCDFWSNNIMFKHRSSETDGEAPIEDIMIIDWEAVEWTTPVLDLQFFLQSSSTLALRRNHLEEILRRYYSIFTNATAQMGATVADWSYKDLKEEWRRTAKMGFLSGLSVNSVALSKAVATSKETNRIEPGFMTAVQAMLSRFLLSIMTWPSVQSLLLHLVRKFYEPIIQEITRDGNELLCTRFDELVTEADDYGVFDV
ncbi:uncharacterized protein LOC121874595 isoform X4 [Homarus americanus]|uniref:Putative Ecdysteroid kinase-containing protein 13 n=1 Tax=Homarus americanus TaxID=6706 RepID=A0A8J5TPX8_HOMAM|nr:uncharacterized protein LOC121874595 isoform X4 [Homarus americanus]KAG7176523.1 putative Ecdysteroid kinase-containing protein 13 [Homarus americanus]